ncbi:MAG: hypothetical protein WDN66_05490 [Candidatus Saccharibacteria bacterium]
MEIKNKKSIRFVFRPAFLGSSKPEVKSRLPLNRQKLFTRVKFAVNNPKEAFRKLKKAYNKHFIPATLGSIFVLVLIVVLGLYIYSRPNYTLSSQAQALVGKADAKLVSKGLTYNLKAKTYYLNKSSIGSSQPTNSVSVGTYPYSLELPKNLNSGVTYYDDKSDLSFSLTPSFKTHSANNEKINNKGQFIYPIGRGDIQAVYTIKANGLQEDLVVNKKQSSNLSFSYRLKLPKTLQAKMMPSGAIGIYSANSYLYDNISYGSSADQLLVQKARQNSQKTNLVFVLAPPAVYDKSSADSVGNARLSLNNNLITMNVSGLQDLHYPLTIDPSVIVSSASTFGQAGNNEGDIAMSSSSNQISEGGLDGGVLSSNWSPTTSLPTGTQQATTVANNGYIYEIGGDTNSLITVTTVDYAQINSNGTIGSWSPTTSLPVATYLATSVAYNGYVYEIGGSPTNSSLTANVYYAPINTNGTIGSWSPTTSLPAAINDATSVTYNGYVYEIGGENNTTNVPTVDYALINADGTLGSWTSTTSLPNANNSATSVVYNGYVYELGGYTTTAVATVEYAPINSNGTLGSWTTTTSLPYANYGGTSVIYNGYVYEIGGYITAAVEYAPLNSDGTVGSWQATASLPIYTFNTASIAYNGYIYDVGGYSNIKTAVVDYIAIGPAGEISSSIQSQTFPTGIALAGLIATNGYLFVVGGCSNYLTTANENCDALNTNIYYAQIQSNGTLGSWSTYTSAGVGAFGLAAFAYNGEIYTQGGCTTAGSGNTRVFPCGTNGFVSTVYYDSVSSIISSGGGFTSSSIGSALPAGYFNTATVYNGYVYLRVGCTGTGQNYMYCNTGSVGVKIYSAQISSVSSWSFSASNYAGTYTSFGDSLVASGGYLYDVGGCSVSLKSNGCATYLSFVDYVSIPSTGFNGTQSLGYAGNSLTTSEWTGAVGINNGYLYEFGGCVTGPSPALPSTGNEASGICGPNSSSAIMQYAPINSNGTIGAFTASVDTLAQQSWELSGTTSGGYLYTVGGCNLNSYYTSGTNQGSMCGGALLNTVNTYQINNGGPGNIGTWNAATSLGTATSASTSVAYNGYIYVLGGYTSTYQSSVYYASISSSGALGSWTPTSNMPAGLRSSSSVVYNGYVYELGGQPSSVGTTSVYYSQIGSGGGLGAWSTATNSLPVGLFGGSAVTYNGYIYYIGGDTGSIAVTTVYYSQVGPNGVPGAWSTAANSLPVGTYGAGYTVNNGYVYEIGGYTTANTANVYYMQIGSNGVPGAWIAANSLPTAARLTQAAAYNGYLYAVGGIGATGILASTEYASINSNGTISQWMPTTSLPHTSDADQLTVYDGYLYDLEDGATSTATEYAPLDSIPRVGVYSDLIDLTGISGDNPNPTYLISQGTNTGNPGLGGVSGPGGVIVNYSFASNACAAFNTQSSLVTSNGNQLNNQYPLIFTADGCSNATNLGRYMYVRYTLDDSQTASFPDSSGNHTTISGFTVYYHPATTYRLKGGMTLSNGNKTSLDTQ